ncbi:hypothetical protein [Mucilaginibacter polytrichastri]|uniref:hypothetical protein n=1 Tax=Mucilaginibacter polytrichastri TaxID=1302689 RepID=UPI0008F01B90|nr:hypothetical protein [Mucilaginibacter polytrichastri]SFS95569.1 hypothetical protein SAMN04487890_10771 [Mucilaginibacter polytrichastri]
MKVIIIFCHSERSEESSSICTALIQSEEDISLSLNMTKRGEHNIICHSECNEESSSIRVAALQGEEDISLALNMTKWRNKDLSFSPDSYREQ